MTNRTNVNAMAEKYKAEMMRIYNRAGNSNGVHENREHSREIIEDSRPPVEPPVENFTEDSPPPADNTVKIKEAPSKFPSPDEIMKAENKAVHTAAYTDEGKGNYSVAENSGVIEDTPLEPLYNGPQNEQSLEDMKGSGYIKAEITTAGGAVPIEGASVIITKREGDRTLLIRMLTTDASGSTELVALPAPDIVYSETPDPESKPFSEYIMSIYAEGFYAVPEIIVPVFTTVKSIQPVSLVPLAQFEMQGSTTPAENSRG